MEEFEAFVLYGNLKPNTKESLARSLDILFKDIGYNSIVAMELPRTFYSPLHRQQIFSGKGLGTIVVQHSPYHKVPIPLNSDAPEDYADVAFYFWMVLKEHMVSLKQK